MTSPLLALQGTLEEALDLVKLLRAGEASPAPRPEEESPADARAERPVRVLTGVRSSTGRAVAACQG